MQVTNLNVCTVGGNIRYSGDFTFGKFLVNPSANFRSRIKNGFEKKFTVWICVPNTVILSPLFADSFFVASLGLALAMNEDLDFQGEVSQDLIKKIPLIKKFLGFPRRSIRLSYKVTPVKRAFASQQGQFFTLGVDSFYTLLCNQAKRREQKQQLLFIDGFDIPLRKVAFLETVHRRIRTVAKATNASPLFIQTNLKEVSDKIINWGEYHTVALAAVGMILPLQRIVINGESFERENWGLRFGVDKVFSLKNLRFELRGHNITRDSKIRRLQASPQFMLFLRHVRVCWKNVLERSPSYNCCRCQKCLRTQLTLMSLGVKNAPTFKPLTLTVLKKTLLIEPVRREWEILYALLKKTKEIDPEVTETVAFILNRPPTMKRRLLHYLQKNFFLTTKVSQ